ncbi:PhoD-like phosphatase [Fragilaria crotonensis]|nr:PhoD-like phosphatase [Fragilaria crotonensis]
MPNTNSGGSSSWLSRLRSSKLQFLSILTFIVAILQFMHKLTPVVSRMTTLTEEPFSFEPVHGPIVGECTETSVVIWHRDELGLQRPPKIVFWPAQESSEAGAKAASTVSVSVNPDADYTSQTTLTNLTPNTRYNYKIGDRLGSFKTPGSASCSFVFGSCIGGQGYGRNAEGSPDGEGFPIFETALHLKPDFWLLNGDSIYADDSIAEESRNPWNKGSKFVTQNGVRIMPAVTKLEGFRGRYKYHLEDKTYSEFLRNCPTYTNWDDHEILDNFGQKLLRETGLGQLFDEGRQAFLEYWPRIAPPEEPNRIYKKFSWGPHVEVFILDSRSYRDVHTLIGDNITPTMQYIMGSEQRAWLQDGLSQSKKTWKIIATSVPLSYPTGWPSPDKDGYDGWSNGKNGLPGGPELELLTVFEHIRNEGVENVVFLAGDVHFPYAISYDPFNTGKPLCYEIGASPFHSLCLSPPEAGPDDTFNPTVLFAQGSFGSKSFNFGHVTISEEGRFSFNVRDQRLSSIYNLELIPAGLVGHEMLSDRIGGEDSEKATATQAHLSHTGEVNMIGRRILSAAGPKSDHIKRRRTLSANGPDLDRR